MNEHGVAIGETTFDGLGSLAEQDGAIIDYYSLMWLALQRSATAREAILTMDSLTKLYGCKCFPLSLPAVGPVCRRLKL